MPEAAGAASTAGSPSPRTSARRRVAEARPPTPARFACGPGRDRTGSRLPHKAGRAGRARSGSGTPDRLVAEPAEPEPLRPRPAEPLRAEPGPNKSPEPEPEPELRPEPEAEPSPSTGRSRENQRAAGPVPHELGSRPESRPQPPAEPLRPGEGAVGAPSRATRTGKATAAATVETAPRINPRLAALVTGLIVGAVGVVIRRRQPRPCEAVRPESAAGGAPTVRPCSRSSRSRSVGAALLKDLAALGPDQHQLPRVGLVAVMALLFFLRSLESVWMLVVIPVLPPWRSCASVGLRPSSSKGRTTSRTAEIGSGD